jgi:large subunit ribosomal protein L4e
MFAPTRIWRRWHRKINTNQKRYSVASALAASALPSLVLARGHRIAEVPEIPLVVPTSVESLQKTKQAVAALAGVGAGADLEKVKASRKLRAGKGKMRNRRHVQRLGPLVVYNEDQGIVRAFRNLPGVELAQVERLNLLQLAPGGHMGRFIVWTKAAFDRLNEIYGAVDTASKLKTGYTLPRNIMGNSDLTRIINSDEIQSKLRPTNNKVIRARHKKNPLKNLGVLVRLNPYALSLRRAELLQQKRAKKEGERKEGEKKATTRKVVRQVNKIKKANYTRINRDDLPASETAAESGTAEKAEAEPTETAPPATEPKAAEPKAAETKAEAPAAAPAKPAGKKAASDY